MSTQKSKSKNQAKAKPSNPIEAQPPVAAPVNKTNDPNAPTFTDADKLASNLIFFTTKTQSELQDFVGKARDLLANGKPIDPNGPAVSADAVRAALGNRLEIVQAKLAALEIAATT